MPSIIPIENVYYLFCYAWQRFDQAQLIDVGATESPSLQDLLARVLIQGTRHLLRRGLDRSYRTETDTLSTLRGRVAIADTLRLSGKNSISLVCQFDELSRDTLPNQLLKATVVRLSQAHNLDRDLAHELRAIARLLPDVTGIRLTSGAFRRVQLHRNVAFYDFLLKVCRLVVDCTLPDERGHGFSFSDVLRDDDRMALVFQDFVRNFYRVEQKRYSISPLQLKWDAVPQTLEAGTLLPQMVTDIHLRAADDIVIIDTKFYADWAQRRFDVPKLRSKHLYQLFSYLRNAEALGEPYRHCRGMLLYPCVDRSLDLSYDIQGHAVSVHTIDLGRKWREIEHQLLRILDVG